MLRMIWMTAFQSGSWKIQSQSLRNATALWAQHTVSSSDVFTSHTDCHKDWQSFFFYFKNSESVIRWELWHFPVKWFDSPTVISSVISSSVISSSQAVMSSSQASCLVPVCLNEILPADKAFANKRKKHMSSISSGEKKNFHTNKSNVACPLRLNQ